MHFYPYIDEIVLTGIVESFAPQAITEVPLVYIKYVDSDDKELGLLVTSNKMYAPENSILLKDINSIAYEEHFGITDTIQLLVNQQFFSNINMIIWDKSMSSFSGLYKREFKTDEILNMIVAISDNVIRKNKSK